MEWIAFERVSGPLLLHDRIDYAAAFIAYTTAVAHGVKIRGRTPRFRDFAFSWDGPQVVESDAAEDLGRIFGEAASQPSPHSS